MHIGHNHEDLDQQDLAIRHLGAGIIKEQLGDWGKALYEYQAALALDPELEEAQRKFASLRRKLDTCVEAEKFSR